MHCEGQITLPLGRQDHDPAERRLEQERHVRPRVFQAWDADRLAQDGQEALVR